MNVSKRSFAAWAALSLGGLTLGSLAGCENKVAEEALRPYDDEAGALGGGGGVDPAVVLKQVIELIRAAAGNPGGANFTLAASSLNDFFLGTRSEEFAISPEVRRFLIAEKDTLPPNGMDAIGRREFDPLFDGRHLDDTLLLSGVARAILSRGEPLQSDLAKARRIFDWVVQNVQLVPVGMLGPAGPDGQGMQPPARPYDVAVRGLASEDGVEYADRSWLFLALCRQAGIDAAMLALVDPNAKPTATDVERGEAPVTSFACGVLENGKVYLFDLRHGLVIADASGAGVATCEEAASDPEILERFDVPGRPYPIHQADLERGRLRVLLDATSCSLAPRMKLLQDRLAGDDRMVLYSDPTELAAKFAAALGPKLESTHLWSLPLKVEFLLFHDGAFNQATGHAMRVFDPRWPLVQARHLQLRGDLDQAIQRYVGFRYADEPLENDGKTPIDKTVQSILDIYATQFLALAQLDKGRPDEAAFLFGESLRLLPEPGPGMPYFTTFRWGANRNLGVLAQARGEHALAARYFTQPNPTDDARSNRLRAQESIWVEPFVPDAAVPLPSRGPTAPPTGRPAGGARTR